MDIMCEKQNFINTKETQCINILYNKNKKLNDDDVDNNLNSNISIKRIDSFDCNSSIHTFDPNKSSPPKKFFYKGNLRLDMY